MVKGPLLRDIETGMLLRKVGKRTVRQTIQRGAWPSPAARRRAFVEVLRHVTWNRRDLPTSSKSRLTFAFLMVMAHPCCQEAAPFDSHSKSDRVSRSKEVVVSYQTGLSPLDLSGGCSGIAEYQW